MILRTSKIKKTIINKRNEFIKKYFEVESLILDYQNNENITLKIINTSNESILEKNENLFYSLPKIIKEIDIKNNDTDEQKVIKIHDFIRNRSCHSIPPFQSDELHNPPRYFSTYSMGLCDDAARTFNYLANYLGFKSDVWFLGGHVVADVYYNNKWHIIDPDSLGIVKYNNDIASIDEMIILARQNHLPRYNDVYVTENNNKKEENYEYKKIPPDNPYLFFHPYEEKIFLNKLYIIPTQGKYLDVLDNKEKYFHSNRSIANIIYKIPISYLPKKKEISINSYFPITSVIIETKNENNKSLVKLDTKEKLLSIYLKGFSFKINSLFYYDFTYCCKNLEKYPTRTITVKNFATKENYNSFLLIITYYSKDNFKALSELNKITLSKKLKFFF